MLLVCLVPASAPAATVKATSNADSGAGTLRGLLATAGPGDTILVPGSFTITLVTPLTVTQPKPLGVTISATGSGMPTISGGGVTNIFSLNSNTALTVNRLLLTRGRGGDGNAIEGGVASVVAINDSVLSDNGSGAASGDGGAIQMGGSSTATIQRSTLLNNFGGTSSGNGGAIQMNSPGTLSISQSTFSGNRAGPATGDGGAIQMNGPGTLTISQSTLSGNSSGASGDGGAIQMNSPGTLNLTNTTLFSNSAGGHGGAIQMNSPGTGSIISSTIAGNRATGPTSVGGGIRTNNSPLNSLRFTSTIVSGNTAPNGSNCGATVPPLVSLGHNIENGTSCGFIAGGDLNADPRLDALLRDNGGPTSTLALLPGSPALDKGSATGADQRGAPRPFNFKGIANSPGGNGADIGAYERILCGGKVVNRVGTAGRDQLKGTKGSDGILGLGGKDTLKGLAGKDGLCGGKGKDKLVGGKGKDKCVGGKGRDSGKGCEKGKL
jgi:hypothetical protein